MTASAWPRRVLRRRSLDTALDWFRFRLDTFPRRGPLRGTNLVNYQPLPWVGLGEGDRTEGTLSRWREIESVLAELPDLSTGLDIGANQGFFAINLAKRGVTTVALEVNPVAYRTALYASRKAGVPERVSILTLDVRPDTVALVPHADVVLFLSVWHHLVLRDGLDAATDQLRAIWERTGRVLFFEAGDEGVTAGSAWPSMEPDPKAWLTRYLSEACAGGEIRHLGSHTSSDADSHSRHLFAVLR